MSLTEFQRHVCRLLAAALSEARTIVDALPPAEVGRAVLTSDGRPFSGDASALAAAIADGSLYFHAGAIRGAVPQLRVQ